MHPPLRTQEYALIHLLMHTFIPTTKDAFSLAVGLNNKITHVGEGDNSSYPSGKLSEMKSDQGEFNQRNLCLSIGLRA
jgi:hypothetical protein